MRLINADAFAEAIENLDWYSLHNGKMIQGAEGSDKAYYRASDIYTEINKAVTIRADVIEPKRGRWIGNGFEPLHCSVCGKKTKGQDGVRWADKLYNFCPNCGARMEASDD